MLLIKRILSPFHTSLLLLNSRYWLYKLSEKWYTGSAHQPRFLLRDILQKHLSASSNCIDIGSRDGLLLKQLLRFAPQGKHLAFEGNFICFKKLEKLFDGKIELLNYTLNDREEDISLPDGSENGATHLMARAAALDSVMRKDSKTDLITIDMQGRELPVLKGASQLLYRDKPLVLFRCDWKKMNRYNHTPEQLFDLFHSCGMYISLPEYFLGNKKSLSRPEFTGHCYKNYSTLFIAYDQYEPALRT